MYNNQRKNLILNFSKMYESLNKAVNEAGGNGFSVLELEKMSALDLLEHLCINKIFFYFQKPD